MALFWKVTGKACKRCERSAELSKTQCSDCGGKLKVTTTLRPQRILAFLAATGVLAGAGFEGVRTFRPLQIQVVPTEETAVEAGVASRLSQLGARLRVIYHDCQAGERETAEVAQL